jgi:2-oxoglutarate dehydrogenase E2 component (dihydrolipoamide succinyltransferase)
VRGDDIRRLLAERPAGRPPEGEVLPVSALQRAVARTVTAALTVPVAFTVVKVYLDGKGENPDVLAEVIRATAAQRARYPRFFARLADDGTLTALPGAQIGLTVDTGHGLYMPVLRHAESLYPRDISAALLQFRVKARRARFTTSELSGSNIGITVHTESAVVVAQPVIYPENSCALSVCAVLDELHLAPDGSVRQRNYVNLGLAYDHRVINGRDAVLFLDAIKRDIEGREQ